MGIMGKLLRRDSLLLLNRGGEVLLGLFGAGGMFALFVHFMGLDTGTLELFFGTLLAVFATQQLISLMQLDLNGVFPLIDQLPVDRRTYRRSRYLCAALLTLFTCLLTAAMQAVIRQTVGMNRLDMSLYPMLVGVSCALLLPGYLCGEGLRQWTLRYGQVLLILFQSAACGGLGAAALALGMIAAAPSPSGSMVFFHLAVGFGALLLSMLAVECYHRWVGRSAGDGGELPDRMR